MLQSNLLSHLKIIGTSKEGACFSADSLEPCLALLIKKQDWVNVAKEKLFREPASLVALSVGQLRMKVFHQASVDVSVLILAAPFSSIK